MRARIGISGWRYAGWRGKFYPEGLAQKRELAYAASRFDTIEINGSFYSLQRPESYSRWHDEVPDDFVFAVKGSRYITHMRRLAGVETALANFFASGVLALESKLGPLLWQLPPTMKFDRERLAAFFDLLPRDTAAASRLASKHDARVAGRTHLAAGAKRKLRHAVEVRHESFACPELIDLLRSRRIALVVADTAGRWPLMEDVTADFVYVRLHGDKELYASGYSPRALGQWAERIRAWLDGGEVAHARTVSPRPPRRRTHRDVYVYFDNDAKVHAPFDALRLAGRLGQPERGARPSSGVSPPKRIAKRTATQGRHSTKRADNR
jgi:uncharacterized protein YecE (DUF72 family)